MSLSCGKIKKLRSLKLRAAQSLIRVKPLRQGRILARSLERWKRVLPVDENVCIVSANQDTKGVTVKLGTTVIQQFLNPTSDVTMIRKDVYLEHAPGAKTSVLQNKGESFPLGQKLYPLEGPVQTTLSIDGAEIRTKILVIAHETFPEPLLIG